MTELREMDKDGSSERSRPDHGDVKMLKFRPKVPRQKQKPKQQDPKPIDEDVMKILRTSQVAAKSAPNTEDECSPQKTLSTPPSADVVCLSPAQLGVQKQNQLPLQIPRSFPVPVNSGLVYEEESSDDDDDNDSDNVGLLETQPDSIESEALTCPAEELDLLQQEGSKERMFFFQFPNSLPLPKRSSSAGKEVMEGSNLQQLPQGYLGKMLVYKSGKIKMKLGDIIFDVNPGVESRMLQRAVALNTRDKHCCLLGEIENRHVIVTPNVDSLLNDK